MSQHRNAQLGVSARRGALRAAATAIIAPAVIGCVGHAGLTPSLPNADRGDAFLEVTNGHNHHVQVAVKPLRGSALVLGTIRIQNRREFRLPRTLNGRSNLVILRCVVTGETFETHEVGWEPAGRLTLSVTNMLSLSSLAWRR